MRFLFRLISLLMLVGAVIAGTVDAVRSVANGRSVATPLGTEWASLDPGSLQGLRALVESDVPAPGAALLQWVLSQPAFAVLLCLSLLFYCIGYRRRRAYAFR